MDIPVLQDTLTADGSREIQKCTLICKFVENKKKTLHYHVEMD